MDNLHCAFAVPKPLLGERESSGLVFLLYDGCVTRILHLEQPNGIDGSMQVYPKRQQEKHLVFGLDAAAFLSEISGLALGTMYVGIHLSVQAK